ncbi:hypothetical protein KRE47_07445 [Elizabethkingia meningoseptica]|uniref:DUF6624 domain-containing protein n=1 Tax=Elizabethkingia meningoseptica TaxID=238 RepID=UPI0022F18FE6|nr:DUF6624 domain-containing protein [Elizabethkingia meningoseptica]EJK5330192.1 hypothetical protein [Elizabethkingia meningoseptica]MDE5467867.1 hypothetical protein [Elizabethkingia meningoseptica]MDE5474786.1 hypothetical protein [Elizabethkingia meningoseptica]MDE5478219.1 hypothetical protein [Elizabethkingia meningoseptica]MDE5486618.1 hypothetical protein [Elizabethkingia meningoseptica]
MNKILQITLPLFFSVITFGQDFNSLTKECYSLIEQNNTAAFRQTYPKLYTEYVKEQLPAYPEAIAFLKKNENKKAISSIEKIVDEGYLLDELPTDVKFKKLHQTKEWSALLKKIKDKTPKSKLRFELKNIQDVDQGIRALYLDCGSKFGKQNDKCLFVRKEMERVESVNVDKVLSIIDKYGWLGKDEIGEEGNTTLFLTVQHYKNAEVQKKYLSILEDASKKGKAEPWQYAFLTDRILMNEGKPQIYGTQTISQKGMPPKVYELKDSANVDQLRAKYGMEPLADYLKSFESE